MGNGRQYVQVEGLCIVKQIDGFYENASTESVHVNLVLERVHGVSADDLLRLCHGQEVQCLLGCREGVEKDIVRVPIEAGKFTLFDIGMVLLNGRPVGVLHGEHREVVCKDPVSCGPVDLHRVRHLPGYWKNKSVLTQLEYTIGAANQSHYLLFWNGDRTIEYVLPCMVVFKAFYGISSQFVNAILGRTWKQAQNKLVTPEQAWKNAQDTLVSPQQERHDSNGQPVWPVKLLAGVPANEATLRQLALFLYDAHASRCIASLHSDWLNGGGSVWWNTAQIPYDTGGKGHSMSVHGHVLPKYAERCQRFLITRIVASDWPRPHPIIDHVREEAGPSDDNADDEVSNAGGPRSVRVKGDPNAVHQTGTDPGDGNVQVFRTPPLKYTDLPMIVTTVTVGPPAPPAGQKRGKPEDPAGTVNSGEHASGEGRPDTGEIEQPHRARSEHLEGLENGLKALLDAGVIDGYEPIGTDASAPLYTLRNGHAAWTLAGPNTGSGGTFAKQIASQRADPWAWVWPPGKLQFKEARALLAYKVDIGDWSCILMDIERRPTNAGERYRLFMVAPLAHLDEKAMDHLLNTLRKHEGVLSNDRLTDAFKLLIGSDLTLPSVGPVQHVGDVKAVRIEHPVLPLPEGGVGPACLDARRFGERLLRAAPPANRRGRSMKLRNVLFPFESRT